MDAPLGSVEVDETDELGRLRARAYGPDADISGDPAAQARLTELEAARRRPVPMGTAPAVVDSRPVETRGAQLDAVLFGPPVTPRTTTPESIADEPTTDEPITPASRTVASIADAPGVSDPTPAEPTFRVTEPPASAPPANPPWWRRRRWWAIIAGVVAVFALIGVMYTWLSPRPPDYVLSPQSPQTDPPSLSEVSGYLDWLGIEPENLRSFEQFRGFSVWSAESRYGTDCIVVTHQDLGGTGGCATDGLLPTADIMRYQGWAGEMFGDMPTGSLVRFTLVGDRVNVYLASATLIGSNP